MNQTIKYAVGTDVSKDKLDVCFIEVTADQSQRVKGRRQFSNTPGGHKELDSWCKKHRQLNLPVQVLMEATGVYHEQLAMFLQRKQYIISVVLPTKAKRYMQSIGLKTKNDKIDAIGLGRMCAEQKHDPWQPMAAYFYKLRQLTRYHQRLQETKTSFGNLMHSIEHSAFTSKDVIKYPEKMLDEIQNQLYKVEQRIQEHIRSDAAVAKKVENISKIKGVGC
jgi:transposase